MKRALALCLPALVLAAAFLAGAEPVSAGISCNQPDMQVKGGAADSFLGNNIYNNDGTNQTKSRKVRPGHTDAFVILLENDGSDCSSSYLLSGDGSSPGFIVHYFFGATDITAAVVGGTYFTPVMPINTSMTFSATISAANNVSKGTVKKLLVTASTKGPGDTIGAKDTVNPKAGDAGAGRHH